MVDYEKLGLFYLGREYDLAAQKTTGVPVLYDSRDLVTHAVCVGMTGSGKTGLCLGLIEEAAIDGVPVIAIDPKGDLSNLLLTFPGLAPQEFRPWIDEDEARRAGQSPDLFAEDQARRWKEGLAEWGQDGARIDRLRQSADFAVYTPGSRAGHAVSVLSSFAAPPAAVRDDGELVGERASSTATSVLTLAGAEAAPRSREHTLLALLFSTAWAAGKDLSLAGLIEQVQSPPFEKVGILDLESFFPRKDRFDLALQLNGILAAPGFDQWFSGEPLDPAALFRTAQGKPRVSIFSIAHLGDAERMFFVSLLLNQVVGWMRAQTGTSSLRAIVFMDEISGYFPPVANPPSKGPLLTLLKQARAFGVGVVLATQNPVDLDYKGLSNIGTWFIGRLQTERDKARMLDGLEGAAAGALDRAEADQLLSMLPKRVFLLHNIHQPKPTVFQTRWTMSYLRGPMSREQLTALMPVAPVSRPAQTARPIEPTGTTGTRPVLPPDIEQYFVPGPAHSYAPVALGAARVSFSDTKLGIQETRDVLYAAPIENAAVPVDWQQAESLDIATAELEREPASAGASYETLPAAAQQKRSYAAWQKSFSQWLSHSQRIDLFRHRGTKLTSTAAESERDFMARVQDARRATRDAEIEAVRRKFAAKREALAERLRKAQAATEREQQQASEQKTQTMLSVGAAALGALFGRKAISTGTLGRATTAARGMGRSMKEAGDVKRAKETADAVREQLEAFDATLLEQTQEIAAKFDTPVELERLPLTPKRGQVAVQFVALGWLPRQ
jgi:Helicase HerA, central domain